MQKLRKLEREVLLELSKCRLENNGKIAHKK